MVIAKAGTTQTAVSVEWLYALAMQVPSLSQAESVNVVVAVVAVAVAGAVTITTTATATATTTATATATATVDATATATVHVYGDADEATTRRSHLEQAGSLEPTLPFGVTMIAKAWRDNWLCEIASRFHQDTGLGCGPAGHGV